MIHYIHIYFFLVVLYILPKFCQKPCFFSLRQAIKPPTGKYSRRSANCYNNHPEPQNAGTETPVVKSEENIKKNKELQRLAFFGAGPKLPGNFKLF